MLFVIVCENANGREHTLPDELMKAKTLCLDVRGAVRVPIFDEPAKAEKEASKLEETASEAIKKWGRFEVAPNCASADGALLVRNGRSPGSHTTLGDAPGMEMSNAITPLEFSIVSQSSQQTLYKTVTPDCQSVKTCIKAEIKTLRKKMEKQGN
jgi:hypothetical protein